MARLRRDFDGLTCQLEAEHGVGRSPRNELHVNRPLVSSQHALLRWNGSGWEIRDLGSRNGTWVDDARLTGATVVTLRVGSRLRFGDESEQWTLEDATEPCAMVTTVDDGEVLLADGPLLAVPSADQPEVTLYLGSDGCWYIERDEEPSLLIRSRETFGSAGKTWRFSCPSIVAPTQSTQAVLELRSCELIFGVSPDEEYVELQARCAGRDVDLGSRSQYYMLLTLARLRLADLAHGVAEGLCGWTYQDELLRALNITPTQLNIDVFRVRRQLAATGFIDAAHVIERRPATRQLRLGVSRLRERRV